MDQTMRPGKILFFSAHGFWGMGGTTGSPSLTSTLTGYLEADFEVLFFSGGIKDHQSRFHPNLKVIGLAGSLIPPPQNKLLFHIVSKLNWIIFILESVIKGLRASRLFKPDFCYGYEVHGVPPAFIVAKILGIPCVARYMGTAVPLVLSRFLTWIRWTEHTVAYKLPVDQVIMANDGTFGDKVLLKMGVPSGKIKFWMNGVEKDKILGRDGLLDVRESLGLPPDSLIMMTMCRLVKWKRIDRAISALPVVLKQRENVFLLVVGDGPMYEEWKALAESLQVTDHVVFAGKVPRTQIHEYLRAADVFLSMNDLSNVGNPLLEAMTAGKCVVAVNTGDTASVIEHGVNGILVDPSRLELLPGIVSDVLFDERKRVCLEERAEDYARDKLLSWPERMQKEIESVAFLLDPSINCVE